MKVLILGSRGFLGQHLVGQLTLKKQQVIATCRKRGFPMKDAVYFDILNPSTWPNILAVDPDIIINAAAYGVVKLQGDTDVMYKVNYFMMSELYRYLRRKGCQAYWIQIGTAFEYDLHAVKINSNTHCIPQTHYGISKLMMSHFLMAQADQLHCIIRPFGMFGEYEDESKFFPSLILAQLHKKSIQLSAGTQERDYVYAGDVAAYIAGLIVNNYLSILPAIVNIGSGFAMPLRNYAAILQTCIPEFDASLWRWNVLPFRSNESNCFYYAPDAAAIPPFQASFIKEAFKRTVEYYYHDSN